MLKEEEEGIHLTIKCLLLLKTRCHWDDIYFLVFYRIHLNFNAVGQVKCEDREERVFLVSFIFHGQTFHCVQQQQTPVEVDDDDYDDCVCGRMCFFLDFSSTTWLLNGVKPGM